MKQKKAKMSLEKKTQPDRMGIFNSGCTSYLYLLLLPHDSGNHTVFF